MCVKNVCFCEGGTKKYGCKYNGTSTCEICDDVNSFLIKIPYKGMFCRQIEATLYLWDFSEYKSEPKFELYTTNRNYHYTQYWPDSRKPNSGVLVHEFIIDHDLFQGHNYMQNLFINVIEKDRIMSEKLSYHDELVTDRLLWRPAHSNSYFTKEWTGSAEGKVKFRLDLKNPDDHEPIKKNDVKIRRKRI